MVLKVVLLVTAAQALAALAATELQVELAELAATAAL
jgi:hypothetical protein